MALSNKKIRVLFILPALGAGGAERVLITLMNNIDRERFVIAFLALNESGSIKEWIDDDIEFYSFGERSIKTSILKLYVFIKKHRPNVIFTTMVHSNALVLLMKILFPNIRVVVREAALPSVLISKYGVKGRLCSFVYKLLYPKADLVISNCSQMIDDFENVIKISTHNHTVLFNPVDTSRIFPEISENFIRFEGRENIVHFVSVGRLSYEKGYDRLLEALSNFKPNYDWRFDIIGEGDYHDVLEGLINKLGLEGNVFLRGYHSNPWVIAAQADCLLLPSRWEGMPNVVLEGFACGLPTIAMSEAGGIMDINKYTDMEKLKVVDTINEFVTEMQSVKPILKNKKGDSILPNEFSLSHIVQKFEKMLVD